MGVQKTKKNLEKPLSIMVWPGMKPITTHNPQANAIVERIHQVLNDMIQTYELEETELDETNPFDEMLTSIAYAIRCTYHTVL